ncbi:MAG: apolipoprotein N-acyltransferase [Candidatus Nitronauta litoralis]|uniref:Apolipoprotein N-acyltransferase n=1 Tax=Candidatus Nitronauta litoralis TaxID=2705533 RepID=A0A7T0BZF9_9BACT|nr:MAG: apolipoprotein N-acyltransferase [Candidatus Nitronauta litoralis]
MVFYATGLSWVINTMVNYGHLPLAVSWVILMIMVAYLSLFIALFCLLARLLSRENPLFFFLITPVLWTSLEYFRSTYGVFAFSWLGLGYSQYSKLPLIQIAEFTGVYGVTALIMLVNAGLFYMIHPGISQHPGFKKLRWPIAGITLGLFVGCWSFGNYALKQQQLSPNASEKIKVALIQGNIEQQMKWDPAHKDEVLQRYFKLTEQAGQASPDLIVWPEAATPFYFGADAPRTTLLQSELAKTGIPALIGSPFVTENKIPTQGERPTYSYFNSALYFNEEGAVAGRYDKIHLVPFGEFVPFRKILFFVEKMVVTIGDFSLGDSYDVFDVKGKKFGVNICYEIIFPDLVRRPVKEGAQFLVNITNDAWFGRSAASYQHIAIASLRAVENRVPIVRAANTGITGVIHADGSIHQATGLFKEEVVVDAIAPRAGHPSFYSTVGDAFAFLCIAFTFVVGFLARMRA